MCLTAGSYMCFLSSSKLRKFHVFNPKVTSDYKAYVLVNTKALLKVVMRISDAWIIDLMAYTIQLHDRNESVPPLSEKTANC
jgi:hypothetical protein